MLSYRLRFSQKPLRFAVNDLITPLTGFYVYLALLAFYALFLLFPVNWFGRGFLGVYGRPMTLGLYAFVVITTLSVVVRERHGSGSKWPREPWRCGSSSSSFLCWC